MMIALPLFKCYLNKLSIYAVCSFYKKAFLLRVPTCYSSHHTMGIFKCSLVNMPVRAFNIYYNLGSSRKRGN